MGKWSLSSPRCGLILLGVAVALSDVAAQAGPINPPRVQSAAFLRSPTFGDPPDVVNVGDPSQASLSRGYNGTGYSVTAQSASATRTGSWGGYAEVGGFANFSGFATVQSASYANGFISDNLRIPQGSKLVLPVRLTGSVLVEASASGNLPPSGIVSAGVTLAIACYAQPFDGNFYLTGSDCSKNLTLSHSQAVDTTLLLEIPFQPNQQFTLSLTPTVSASVFGNPAGSPTPVLMSFRAVADFGDTAVFDAAQIYTASGNLLAGVPITSDSGFDYAVPEPGGWTSLAAGSLALAAFCRRRRA